MDIIGRKGRSMAMSVAYLVLAFLTGFALGGVGMYYLMDHLCGMTIDGLEWPNNYRRVDID